MAILPGHSSSDSAVLQDIVNEMRAYPEFTPVLGSSGYSHLPALSIANDLMQRIMAENMPWVWNRRLIPPILTVALQQDYVTQITDIGWLENSIRIDINNSTNNGNLAPKPIFPMEAIRDQPLTSAQNVPNYLSFIPNTLATMGQWTPNTPIGCGYGVAQIPIAPIQQFVDDLGNILYIDSTVLGLNLNSPGFTGTPITLPANSPYGVTGTTKPQAPANATPGATVQDGTVVWTVADPNAYAIRVNPLPAFSGLAWLIQPVYQVKPPTLTRLQDRITPIPPEMTYLFRQGFRAMLYGHAGSPKAEAAYAKFEEDLIVAVRSSDRQQEGYALVPGESIMGNAVYGQIGVGAGNLGPCWPFGPYGL
jgi:hypothetical protein